MTFAKCEALIQSFAGKTIKFGAPSADYGRSEFWAISNIIDDAIASDLACTVELDMNNAYYSRSGVNRYTEDEDGNEGDFWSFNIYYRKEDETDAVYESKRIPLTFEEDVSEERANIAVEVMERLDRDLYVTGEEIKELNSTSHDTFHFNPNNLQAVREVLDSYETAEVTLTEDVYRVYSFNWYDEEEDIFYSGVNFYAGVFVDGYFYGYVDTDFLYESEFISAEGGTHYITHPLEDNIPAGAIFRVEEVDNSAAETVLHNDDEVAVVYDFTLTAANGTAITQFPYGVIVQ